MLQPLDIAIILVYLVGTIIIGLTLRKKAQKSKDDYLLGGKNLPWYMLGLSNASGMFDISGTMWLVTLTFIYGFKSIWIPWLWPVFNQVLEIVEGAVDFPLVPRFVGHEAVFSDRIS